MSTRGSEGSKRYNGWSNYETWCVHLWLTNEEGTYRYWREEARLSRRDSRENATATFAEQLKSELEEASPLEGASLYSDLLSAALSEVDWFEVAETFLEEVKDDEPEPDDDDDEFRQLKRERRESSNGPRFELGQVVTTPGVLQTIGVLDVIEAIGFHRRGYWGEVDRHDWEENELSLREGFRLLSVYRSEKGEKFWVITEADRSVTTILLPSEY